MEKLISEAICDILLNNAALLRKPIAFRSKFEGWLKFELAWSLEALYPDTCVEHHVGNYLVDILSNNSLIEIKTPNTNYQIPGVEKTAERPITKNINDILNDIYKLKKIKKSNSGEFQGGYIAFVMFPIDAKKFKYHINRVINYLGSTSGICQNVLPLSGINTYVFVAKIF